MKIYGQVIYSFTSYFSLILDNSAGSQVYFSTLSSGGNVMVLLVQESCCTLAFVLQGRTGPLGCWEISRWAPVKMCFFNILYNSHDIEKGRTIKFINKQVIPFRGHQNESLYALVNHGNFLELILLIA